MKSSVNRRTVDLSNYPDLVVIYLGMRVNAWYGLKTLVGFGPRIQGAVDAAPPGLLLHEPVVYSLFPPNVGMRQYWKDFDSLERWARSEPHAAWWRQFLRDSGGTGFWHETYFMRGGMENRLPPLRSRGRCAWADVRCPEAGRTDGRVGRPRSGRGGEPWGGMRASGVGDPTSFAMETIAWRWASTSVYRIAARGAAPSPGPA